MQQTQLHIHDDAVTRNREEEEEEEKKHSESIELQIKADNKHNATPNESKYHSHDSIHVGGELAPRNQEEEEDDTEYTETHAFLTYEKHNHQKISFELNDLNQNIVIRPMRGTNS
eukprot:755090_1